MENVKIWKILKNNFKQVFCDTFSKSILYRSFAILFLKVFYEIPKNLRPILLVANIPQPAAICR